MTFDSRCSEDAGNILLSYSVSEDAAAVERGFKFLGVCKDASGGEVHVFEKQALYSQAEQQHEIIV